MNNAPLKTITYRGGLMYFRIPAHWKEEYEEQGGGTFYEDAPDSGTLRLNVLTFTAPVGQLPASGHEYFTKQPISAGERIVQTHAGDGMKMYVKPTEENGEKLDIYRWEIAHCVQPQTFHMAIFTWTILSGQRSLPKFQREIQALSNELSQAYFHPELK